MIEKICGAAQKIADLEAQLAKLKNAAAVKKSHGANSAASNAYKQQLEAIGQLEIRINKKKHAHATQEVSLA